MQSSEDRDSIKFPAVSKVLDPSNCKIVLGTRDGQIGSILGYVTQVDIRQVTIRETYEGACLELKRIALESDSGNNLQTVFKEEAAKFGLRLEDLGVGLVVKTRSGEVVRAEWFMPAGPYLYGTDVTPDAFLDTVRAVGTAAPSPELRAWASGK